MGSPYTTISQIPEARFLRIHEGAERLRGHENDIELCRDYIRFCFPEREDIDATLNDFGRYRKSGGDQVDMAICSFTKALVTETFDQIRLEPDLILSVWSASEGTEYVDPPTRFSRILNVQACQSPEDFDVSTLLKWLLLEGECLPSHFSSEMRPFPFRLTDCFDALLSPENVVTLQKACAPGGLISRVVEELAPISATEHRDLKQISEMLLRLSQAPTWLYAQAWAT